MGDRATMYTESDVRWARNGQGELYCYFVSSSGQRGRPGPFRMYRGRVARAALQAMNAGRYGVQHVTDVGGWLRSNRQFYRFRRRGRATRLTWSNTQRHVAAESAVRREVRRRQKAAGRLMAGWQALARLTGARLPAQVARQRGRGSARMQRSMLHQAVITARNTSGYYPGLQRIVERQMPYLQRKLRQLARRYARETGRKLK